MSTLLHIKTSLNQGNSVSNELAEAFIGQWQSSRPDSVVIERDVAAKPLPHLDAVRFGAFLAAPQDRTPEQQDIARESDELIDELRKADVIVVAAPMYNFGVPSTLKAWFDHIARAGETFQYTSEGPVGLLKDKKAIVVSTRGGAYAGTPGDSQTPFIKTMLNFLGIESVEFVYAENLARSGDKQTRSLEQAREALATLAA